MSRRPRVLLIDYLGATPGAVYAKITHGLAEMDEACQDVWCAGAKRGDFAVRTREAIRGHGRLDG
jgi:hypothetical protein